MYPARALREIYGVHVAVAKIGNATVNTRRVYYRVRDRVRNSGISSIATAKKLMNFEEFHSSSASLSLWLRRNHQICSTPTCSNYLYSTKLCCVRYFVGRMMIKVTLDHARFFPEKQKNTPSTLISVPKVSMLQAKYLSRYIIPPSVVSVIT